MVIVVPMVSSIAPVSYTHLDVYKRQGPIQEIKDLSSLILRRELQESLRLTLPELYMMEKV